MRRDAVGLIAIGLLAISTFLFFRIKSTTAPKPVDFSGTCVSHLAAAPLKLNSLFLLGDSITNAYSYKTAIKKGVESRRMVYRGQKTVSGIGVGQAIELLDTAIEHADVKAADILFTNLGVNNWSQAITDMPSVELLIDTFIAEIKAINSDILILWQEPYGHSPLVSNPEIAEGAAILADYLRIKDKLGDICLIPWSEVAAIDPSAYTDITHPDGVHIWGNENIYLDLTFDYIDTLRGGI